MRNFSVREARVECLIGMAVGLSCQLVYFTCWLKLNDEECVPNVSCIIKFEVDVLV